MTGCRSSTQGPFGPISNRLRTKSLLDYCNENPVNQKIVCKQFVRSQHNILRHTSVRYSTCTTLHLSTEYITVLPCPLYESRDVPRPIPPLKWERRLTIGRLSPVSVVIPSLSSQKTTFCSCHKDLRLTCKTLRGAYG